MLTNKLNLPKPIYNALNSDYQPKEHQYSVTTILNPTRTIILKRRYNKQINQDCSELIWCLFGTAFHSILENAKSNEGDLQEEYLKQNLGVLSKKLEGFYLSGKADLLDVKSKKIIDYKTTGTFKFEKKDFEDYKIQLLAYAWMFKKCGYKVNKGQIVALLRDWQSSKAKYNKTYPQLQVQLVDFKFTAKDFKEIEKLIKNKFIELKKYEDVKDEELPMCTMEERWNQGDKYAIKKKTNVKATKVHNNLESAEKHLKELEIKEPGKFIIEKRPGEDVRCLNYCSCKDFCPYYKMKYKKEGSN